MITHGISFGMCVCIVLCAECVNILPTRLGKFVVAYYGRWHMSSMTVGGVKVWVTGEIDQHRHLSYLVLACSSGRSGIHSRVYHT